LLVDGHRLNDKDYDSGDAGVRVPGRYWPGQHIEIVLFQSGFTHQVPNYDLSEEKRGFGSKNTPRKCIAPAT
jgi:hypothetical protein